MNTIVKFIFLILLAIVIQSCSNPEKNADNNTLPTDSLKNQSKNEMVSVFYSLPSPMEMSALIKRTGVSYSDEYLHNINDAERYTTNKGMALNLGIYGADLSYASFFEQHQTSIKYLGVVKELANNLDIIEAIKDADLKNMEDNMYNKDALMRTMSETFFKSDAYLKENERQEIAAIIVVGGWIESLYIALNLTDKSITKNKDLVNSIIDQYLTLETVILLLQQYESNGDIKNILTDMQQLEPFFTKMIKETTKEIPDKATGKTRSVTEIVRNPTNENFLDLFNQIKSLRDKYTNQF